MSEPTEPTGSGERLLDMMEAAAFLGVAKTTVQRWVWARRIPYLKLGAGNARAGLVRFRPEALRAWVAAQEIQPLEPTPTAEKRP